MPLVNWQRKDVQAVEPIGWRAIATGANTGETAYDRAKENQPSLNEIDNIIADLEKRLASTMRLPRSGRSVDRNGAKKCRGRPPHRKAKKRTITSEGRERQRQAMRRYWAGRKAPMKKSGSKSRQRKKSRRDLANSDTVNREMDPGSDYSTALASKSHTASSSTV